MSSQNILEFRSSTNFNLIYDVSTKPLGAGGFGTVFPATRRINGSKVAIKRVPLRSLPWILQTLTGRPLAFPKELDLLIRAQNCPGVIHLVDYWKDETDLVLVMNHNENATNLLKYIEANGPMKEDEVAHILRQLTRTLQSCRDKGIFHRDVKPENVLYDKTTGETTLIDFGCGELTTSPNEMFTEYSGTVEYAPPEYFLNKAYSAEPATVWSIGCIAFTMIFGYSPFNSKDDIINCAIDMQYSSCSFRAWLFILKCLRYFPSRRPSLDDLLSNWFLVYIESIEAPAEPQRQQETPKIRKILKVERNWGKVVSPIRKRRPSRLLKRVTCVLNYFKAK